MHQLKLWPFGLFQYLYNSNLFFRVNIALFQQLKNGALVVGNKKLNFHTKVKLLLGDSPWPVIFTGHIIKLYYSILYSQAQCIAFANDLKL